jgi:hypothetical protein
MTWRDESEAMRWLWAVEECREARKTDNLHEHLERIAKTAGAELAGKPAKEFPVARLPYVDSE